jgi:hypothetical protein
VEGLHFTLPFRLSNFEPDSLRFIYYAIPMSAAEIINELPKLSEAERRAVREKLSELAAENADVNLCNQSALEGAIMLDRLEDKDAQRKQG